METPLYKQYLFHNEKELFKYSKQKILQIFDIIIKSNNKREIETSINGLRALSEISTNYVNIRKEDVTQKDEFLDYIYESARYKGVKLDTQTEKSFSGFQYLAKCYRSIPRTSLAFLYVLQSHLPSF